MKVTLDEMLALRTVADTGSITAAAERLGQTPSGISRALSRLEDKLGVGLLARTTRRLSLTEEGLAFLAQAREILAAVDEAEARVAERLEHPAGRLRVNAATPFMLHVLAPLAGEFQDTHPQVELVLDAAELPIDLLEAGPAATDVAVRIGPLRDSTLRARPLGASRLRLLASPAYLARHGAPGSVAALGQGHRLLGFTQPESLNHWPLRGAQGADGAAWVVQPQMQASSGETLRALALAGAGIACLADFMTHADRARGDLVELLAAETVPVLQPIHAVYYRNSQLAARLSCFLDFLAQRMAALPWCVK